MSWRLKFEKAVGKYIYKKIDGKKMDVGGRLYVHLSVYWSESAVMCVCFQMWKCHCPQTGDLCFLHLTIWRQRVNTQPSGRKIMRLDWLVAALIGSYPGTKQSLTVFFVDFFFYSPIVINKKKAKIKKVGAKTFLNKLVHIFMLEEIWRCCRKEPLKVIGVTIR